MKKYTLAFVFVGLMLILYGIARWVIDDRVTQNIIYINVAAFAILSTIEMIRRKRKEP